jgi:hypothetical protein
MPLKSHTLSSAPFIKTSGPGFQEPLKSNSYSLNSVLLEDIIYKCVASAESGSLLEMQFLGSILNLLNQNLWDEGQI